MAASGILRKGLLLNGWLRQSTRLVASQQLNVKLNPEGLRHFSRLNATPQSLCLLQDIKNPELMSLLPLRSLHQSRAVQEAAKKPIEASNTTKAAGDVAASGASGSSTAKKVSSSFLKRGEGKGSSGKGESRWQYYLYGGLAISTLVGLYRMRNQSRHEMLTAIKENKLQSTMQPPEQVKMDEKLPPAPAGREEKASGSSNVKVEKTVNAALGQAGGDVSHCKPSSPSVRIHSDGAKPCSTPLNKRKYPPKYKSVKESSCLKVVRGTCDCDTPDPCGSPKRK
ncbi:uncharacterized protein LOC101852477 isoform X2 [Aplysia californica]|uniref:Uncharacterized protein LOC101852477 isoform X2 n=1 Tax=Aplysia californica TaxID=6500 RepID=A0ABM0JQL1_APLCA|nr:uncharacterized protein LOC101852477 isoform X2 [Aplysia californica]